MMAGQAFVLGKARRKRRWILMAAALGLAGCGEVSHPEAEIVLKSLPGWSVSVGDQIVRSRHKSAMILYEKDPATIAVWWGPDLGAETVWTFGKTGELAREKAVELGTLPGGIPPKITGSQFRQVRGQSGQEITFEFADRRARMVYLPGPYRWYVLEALTLQSGNVAEVDQALDQLLSQASFRRGSPLSRVLGPVGGTLLAGLLLYFKIRARSRRRDAISSV